MRKHETRIQAFREGFGIRVMENKLDGGGKRRRDEVKRERESQMTVERRMRKSGGRRESGAMIESHDVVKE